MKQKTFPTGWAFVEASPSGLGKPKLSQRETGLRVHSRTAENRMRMRMMLNMNEEDLLEFLALARESTPSSRLHG